MGQEHELRGGALGSHTTMKKRQLSELLEAVRSWIEEFPEDDEAGSATQEAMNELLEGMQSWQESVPKKGEAQQLVAQIAKKMGVRIDTKQSFYGSKKDPSKGSGNGDSDWTTKGKGKGKSKGKATPPRFDLQKYFAKTDISHNVIVRRCRGRNQTEGLGMRCCIK